MMMLVMMAMMAMMNNNEKEERVLSQASYGCHGRGWFVIQLGIGLHA